MKGKRLTVLFGVVSVVVLLGAAGVLSYRSRQIDVGGSAGSEIRGQTPSLRNNPMKPVGATEADRRAAVNHEKAQEAKGAKDSFVAPAVIAESRPPEKGELPEPPMLTPAPAPTPEPVNFVPPQVPAAMTQVSVTPIDQAVQQRITSQIQEVLKPPVGLFVTRAFPKPERSPAQASGNAASVQQVMIARAGDVAYARLDRGFNSDDPGAPIFATIVDIDERGMSGPLNGTRLMGTIAYSASQASLQFTQLIWQDGRSQPLKAIAISEAEARTGIADKVDYHTLERYGGLLLGSLIQGVGQVGQMITQNNGTTTIDPTTGLIVTSSNNVNWSEAAAGALLPVGQAMSTAAAAQFNRKPTMSAAASDTIGVVFLDPVVWSR